MDLSSKSIKNDWWVTSQCLGTEDVLLLSQWSIIMYSLQPLTNQASPSLRNGENGYNVLDTWLVQSKGEFSPNQPWRCSSTFLKGMCKTIWAQTQSQDTMKALVLCFPFHFLFIVSFTLSFPPHCLQVLDCFLVVNFLQKEKSFHFSLCVSALWYPIRFPPLKSVPVQRIKTGSADTEGVWEARFWVS